MRSAPYLFRRAPAVMARYRGLLKPVRQAFWRMSVLIALAVPAWAEPLLITGPDGEFSFSQEDILALSDQQVVTETPWTDGSLTFRGAPLAAVLAEAGIEQGWVNARGLNNYSINLPVEQVVTARAFLAVHLNGELMRIKDKGPFWIVFPWSDHPDLLTRDVRAWSVWQLQALSVLD